MLRHFAADAIHAMLLFFDSDYYAIFRLRYDTPLLMANIVGTTAAYAIFMLAHVCHTLPPLPLLTLLMFSSPPPCRFIAAFAATLPPLLMLPLQPPLYYATLRHADRDITRRLTPGRYFASP